MRPQTSSKLVLRRLQIADEAAFLAGLREWDGEDLSWYTFDYKPGMAFEELLRRLENSEKGIGLASHHVPSSMLYAFVEGQIVGRISIRHKLNEYLAFRGGHFGYAVAPRFRRKGYATEIVEQALPVCRELGIERALITCSDANVASWKIIEAFGGLLENCVYDPEANEKIRRYWLALS